MKGFLKSYREYLKTNCKDAKLKQMSDCMRKSRDFMIRELGWPRPWGSFDLLWHKVVFLDALDEQADLHASLNPCIGNGLGSALEEVSSSSDLASKFSADLWLWSLVSTAFVTIIKGKTDDDPTKEDIGSLSKQVESSIGAIKGDTFMAKACEGVMTDLGHINLILTAAMEKAPRRVQDLALAMKQLGEKRCKAVKQALEESKFGKGILSIASVVLQSSAKDVVGHEKLQAASRVLLDDRMPRLVRDEMADSSKEFWSDGMVVNFNLLADGGVTDILNESLTSFSEALTLFSRISMESHIDDIDEWVELIVQKLSFYDEMTCIFLQALVASTELGLAPSASPGSAAMVPASGPNVLAIDSFNRVAVAKVLEEHMHDETSFVEFVHKLVEYLEARAPELLRGDTKVQDLVEIIKARILHNASVRVELCDALAMLGLIGELPTSSKDAVEEWRTKCTMGRSKDSFFDAVLVLVGHLSQVEELQGFNFDRVGPCAEGSIKFDCEGGQTWTGSIAQTDILPSFVLSLPTIVSMRDIIRSGLQLVVDEFASSLQLQALSLQPLHMAGGDVSVTMQGMVQPLFAQSGWQVFVKTAGKVFNQGGKRDVLWPSSSLFELASGLVDIVPSADMKVSMNEFCHPLARHEWTDKEQLLLAMKVWMGISHISGTMAFLAHKGATVGDYVKDRRLKGEVELAMSFCKQKCGELNSLLAKASPELTKSTSGDGWIFPLASAKAWLEQALGIVPVMAKHLVVEALASTVSVAHDLAKVTPPWSTVVTDEKVNKNLARKGLLQWPSRDRLNNLSVLLFHCTADVARLHTTWSLQPDLGVDPDTKDDVDLSQGIWKEAVKAITMIACVNTLYELTGDEKINKAKELLAKKRSVMPKALLAEMEKAAAEKPTKTGSAGIKGESSAC